MKKEKISIIDILRSSGGWRLKAIKLFDHIAGGCIASILPSVSTLPSDFQGKRVLVIRPGGLGDMVFLLPFLRKMKDAGIRTDILCESRNAGIPVSQPGLVERVFRYDHVHELTAVFRNHYDIVIDTEQWHHLSAVTARLVKAPVKAGFATRPSRERLFNIRVPYDQGYELTNFLRLFERVFPDLFYQPVVLEGSYVVDEQHLQAMRLNLPVGQAVAVFIGASISERRLTKEQWVPLLEHLRVKKKTIILLGGREVNVLAEQLTAGNSPHIMNYAGKTDVLTTAALIKISGTLIGGDSGILHLAAAVGAKTTGIFGPGNADKWAPRGEKHTILSLKLPCSPCTRFGYTLPSCCGNKTCLKNIFS